MFLVFLTGFASKKGIYHKARFILRFGMRNKLSCLIIRPSGFKTARSMFIRFICNRRIIRKNIAYEIVIYITISKIIRKFATGRRNQMYVAIGAQPSKTRIYYAGAPLKLGIYPFVFVLIFDIRQPIAKTVKFIIIIQLGAIADLFAALTVIAVFYLEPV